MDKQIPTNGNVQPAIPKLGKDAEMKDIDAAMNGIKRKASASRPSYAEAESSDDDLPLV